MKTFDWEIAEKMHGRDMIALFRDLYDLNLSESVFVQRFVALPVKNEESIRGRRTPSRARSTYRNLKNKFGF